MAYTVVHCGTGNIGATALKAIIDHPNLELVGHYVSTPDKAGRDSAELVGLEPVDVTTTNDWSELLALGADCLTYFGNSIGREADAISDLVPFLERGTNVVTFSGFAIAHPATTPPEFREPIEAACREGNSSCYFTGIDPGWATTDLAIASLAVANRIDCIRVMELGYWGDYTAEFVCREYFGFGKSPGFQPLLVTGGFIETMWAPTLQQLAEVLGIEIEETPSAVRDRRPGPRRRNRLRHSRGGHRVRRALRVPGPVRRQAGRDRRACGLCRPRRRQAVEAAVRPSDMAFRVEVEGDPSYAVELSFGAGGDTLSAMPVLNAIPAVCQARPGLLGPLDVPRYWSRNVAKA
jgi:2,4-diaminopentanoate dehydrogenase